MVQAWGKCGQKSIIVLPICCFIFFWQCSTSLWENQSTRHWSKWKHSIMRTRWELSWKQLDYLSDLTGQYQVFIGTKAGMAFLSIGFEACTLKLCFRQQVAAAPQTILSSRRWRGLIWLFSGKVVLYMQETWVVLWGISFNQMVVSGQRPDVHALLQMNQQKGRT